MGESERVSGSSGEKPSREPDGEDEARGAALMWEVLRKQEQHREGGIEPALGEKNEDPPVRA